LEKIAIVHLYSQGYRDESLVKFKLSLTNPSTIFEKEKIEIWGNKVQVASDMMENKLFSKDWIYSNLWGMSDDDKTELQNEIVEDSKQFWRFKSIEEDGNDPAKPFQQINPQDSGDKGGDQFGDSGPDIGGPPGGGPEGDAEEELSAALGGELPAAGSPGAPLQELTSEEGDELLADGHGEHADDWVRPSQAGEKDASKYPFGEDPLGDMENHEDSKSDRSLTTKERPSTLSLEHILESKLITTLSSYLQESDTKAELINESDDKKKSLLDESNIIDE